MMRSWRTGRRCRQWDAAAEEGEEDQLSRRRSPEVLRTKTFYLEPMTQEEALEQVRAAAHLTLTLEPMTQEQALEQAHAQYVSPLGRSGSQFCCLWRMWHAQDSTLKASDNQRSVVLHCCDKDAAPDGWGGSCVLEAGEDGIQTHYRTRPAQTHSQSLGSPDPVLPQPPERALRALRRWSRLATTSSSSATCSPARRARNCSQNPKTLQPRGQLDHEGGSLAVVSCLQAMSDAPATDNHFRGAVFRWRLQGLLSCSRVGLQAAHGGLGS